jgi:hypothetical protein
MTFESTLYNALPYLYTVGGVTTLLLSGEPLGRISGVLLISASMLIFHLRLEYRTKRADLAEGRRRRGDSAFMESRVRG